MLGRSEIGWHRVYASRKKTPAQELAGAGGQLMAGRVIPPTWKVASREAI